MAEQYNPDILQKYSDILYAQARSLAAWTALRYGAIFAIVTWLAVAVASPLTRMRIDTSTVNTIALIAGFVGLLMGYNTGKVKAFSLVLQAQQVLCQRQIELNTRKQDAAITVSHGS
jgi:membrane associated rhomboid family serine protease